MLIGATLDEDPHRLISVNLARVPDVPNVVEPVLDAGRCPTVDATTIESALGLPFSVGDPNQDEPMIDVHVRFDPRLTDRLRECVWHRGQRVAVRKNGELDVQFGPVPLPAAASWVASFGSGVQVMGNKRLRKVIKKTSFMP